MIFIKGSYIFTEEWQTVKAGHKLLSRSLKYLKKAYRDRNNSIIYDHFEEMPTGEYWDLKCDMTESVGISNSAIDVCMYPPYYGSIYLGKRCYAKPPFRTAIFFRGFKENMRRYLTSGCLDIYWYSSSTGDYFRVYIDLWWLAVYIYAPGRYTFSPLYILPDCIQIDTITTNVTELAHIVLYHDFEQKRSFGLWRGVTYEEIPTYDCFWLYFKIDQGWKAKFETDAVVAYQIEPYGV